MTWTFPLRHLRSVFVFSPLTSAACVLSCCAVCCDCVSLDTKPAACPKPAQWLHASPQNKQLPCNIFTWQKLACEPCQVSLGASLRSDWCDRFFGNTQLFGVLLNSGMQEQPTEQPSKTVHPNQLQWALFCLLPLGFAHSCSFINSNGEADDDDDDDAERGARLYVYWHYKKVIRCSQTCDVAPR